MPLTCLSLSSTCSSSRCTPSRTRDGGRSGTRDPARPSPPGTCETSRRGDDRRDGSSSPSSPSSTARAPPASSSTSSASRWWRPGSLAGSAGEQGKREACAVKQNRLPLAPFLLPRALLRLPPPAEGEPAAERTTGSPSLSRSLPPRCWGGGARGRGGASRAPGDSTSPENQGIPPRPGESARAGRGECWAILLREADDQRDQRKHLV